MTPLERALETVIADLPPEVRARHRFHFTEWQDGQRYLALEDGRAWSGGASLFEDSEPGVGDVAECMQDLMMEVLWIVWPECPAHNFGLHVDYEAGRPMWRCRGGSHVVAPIGALDGARFQGP